MPLLPSMTASEPTMPSAVADAPTKAQFHALLRHNIALILRSVAHVELRYMARVLRSLPYVRRQLPAQADVLARLVRDVLSEQGVCACLYG